MEMRAILSQALDAAMQINPRIVVVDADLARANGTLALRSKYPDRAFDVGVAEQNMASVAAGLSSHGFIPFIGSFSTFASRRICDQVAISIAYARRPVKIIGTDPGLSAELNGGTHMGLEDIAVLRSTPTMVIVEPSDGVQLAQAIPQIIDYDGPVYLRLHRKETPDIYGADYRFDLFKADVVKSGSDVTIVAAGVVMMQQALKAVALLAQKGIEAELIDMHTIKPVDVDTLVASAQKTRAVVTAENHNIIGGLASAVSEALAQHLPTPVCPVGVRDRFGEVGKLGPLLEAFHMTAEDIAEAAEEIIKHK